VPYSYEAGTHALIMFRDAVAGQASRMFENYYPPSVFDMLHDKSQLGGYLAAHGFRVLRQQFVTSADQITLTNFIVKPMRGTNVGSMVARPSEFKDFEYRRFRDVDDLRVVLGDRLEMFLSNGYVIQEAVMEDITTTVCLMGTINGKSEVRFCRVNVGQRYCGQGAMRVEWGFEGYQGEKNMIRDFVARVGVRNAAFNLQMILKDGVLYPMDWNFRMTYGYVSAAMQAGPEELTYMLAHMLDITLPPATFDGVWISTEKAKDGAFLRTVRT
jgi:hypothetical protein